MSIKRKTTRLMLCLRLKDIFLQSDSLYMISGGLSLYLNVFNGFGRIKTESMKDS
jgi:hypothetical protein